MLSFPYYGTKCFSFIFGVKYSFIYKWLYVLAIPFGAAASLGFTVGIFDGAYALMAFPTMISAILLSPKVIKASKEYFGKLKAEK